MKKIKIFILASVIMITLAVTIWAVAFDSSSDPLVSLSYITDIFKPQIEKSISSSEASLKAEIEALNKKIDSLMQTSQPTSASAQTPDEEDGYEVLFVSKGEKILAETQCEIILRVGAVSVVSAYENQGVADLTGGKDLSGGTDVEKNHLLLVPRGGDGRGVVVTSDSAYIMVRGEYSIVKPE